MGRIYFPLICTAKMRFCRMYESVVCGAYKGGRIFLTVHQSKNAQELKDHLKNKKNKVIRGEEIKKKGSSQRGSGSYVPAHLNDSSFFEDIIPQAPYSVKKEASDCVAQTLVYALVANAIAGNIISQIWDFG